MIHEAIDTAISLGWALAVTRGVAAGLAAVQRGGVPEVDPGAEKPAEARTAPSWAQPDKEAA